MRKKLGTTEDTAGLISDPSPPAQDWGQPKFEFLYSEFDRHVLKNFGASTPVSKTTGCADPTPIIRQAFHLLSPDVDKDEDYPVVLYETEFTHLNDKWQPLNDVLKGVAREREFLRRVEWFFEEYCFSGLNTLAGVEEPKTAARRFSKVNYWTLTDEIRIDLRKGTLYAADQSESGWKLIFSDIRLCAPDDFDRLSEIMNNNAQTTIPVAAAEYKKNDSYGHQSEELPDCSTGYPAVWAYLKKLKSQDCGLSRGSSRTKIADEMYKLSVFKSYSRETRAAYVGRALNDPGFWES